MACHETNLKPLRKKITENANDINTENNDICKSQRKDLLTR